MTAHLAFPRPPKASKHCRHYSYKLPITLPDSGPHCAAGHDMSAPGAAMPCMPEPRGACCDRAEYTDQERAAWRAAVEASQSRLAAALRALPSPIPLRTSGTVKCPNCGGALRYARWRRGAEVGCDTDGCCGARFSIAADADWPVFAQAKEEDRS
ncbi:hypothetical protein [Sphingomonas abaci]|uniref:Uncharacterized protein n=1 Tax=Sphingomonas abaci TaxID=237611 RepID=A0A7W7EYP8_9SPHN|nr:hypothetical protein [Sphingomonas abaci]MBB4618993.1 hypothetical protein [Sphingomonas abaci]